MKFLISQGPCITVQSYFATNDEVAVIDAAVADYSGLLRGDGSFTMKMYSFADFADLIEQYASATSAPVDTKIPATLRAVHERNRPAEGSGVSLPTTWRESLYRFRGAAGQSWKQMLMACWNSGNWLGVSPAIRDDLQRVRDVLGAHWLIELREQEVNAMCPPIDACELKPFNLALREHIDAELKSLAREQKHAYAIRLLSAMEPTTEPLDPTGEMRGVVYEIPRDRMPGVIEAISKDSSGFLADASDELRKDVCGLLDEADFENTYEVSVIVERRIPDGDDFEIEYETMYERESFTESELLRKFRDLGLSELDSTVLPGPRYVSTYPDEDREYFEESIDKHYSLSVDRINGREPTSADLYHLCVQADIEPEDPVTYIAVEKACA